MKDSSTRPSKLRASASSVVGIYLKVITPDPNGNIWVGGSVFLQRGLLLRHDGRRTTAAALTFASTVSDLVFTGPVTAWMIANHQYLYRSNDGGQTWQESLKSETNLTSICFSDPKDGWVAGWNGVIFNTTDSGASWSRQESGTRYDFKKIQFADSLHGWAMGGKWIGHPLNKGVLTFITTKDGGETWKTVHSSALPSITAFVDSRQGWGLHGNNILRTTDGGEHWEIQRKGNDARLSCIFFLNEREGWVAGEEVLHTDDGGKTWRWINEDSELPNELDHIVFTSSAAGWGIEEIRSGEGPRILSTTDGGKSWEVVADAWKAEIVDQVRRDPTVGKDSTARKNQKQR